MMRGRVSSHLFQSTLLQEERLQDCWSRRTILIFQSTLLQEERHIKPCNISRFSLISIHAPTRGATSFSVFPAARSFISIHAPTRGATVSGNSSLMKRKKFQSTLLQEERHCHTIGKQRGIKFQSTLLQEERRCPVMYH